MSHVFYACMPLVSNVPQGQPDWSRTQCPECGQGCWRTSQLDTIRASNPGATIVALCTQCSLRKGLKR